MTTTNDERAQLYPPSEDAELAAFYPDGRYLYYEGDDPAAFLADLAARGIEATITAEIPAEALGPIHRAHVMGS